jgi:ribosomal protein S11
MSLSNSLLQNLAAKLQLDISLLQEERSYEKKILAQVAYLQQLKKNNFKSLSLEQLKIQNEGILKGAQDFMVMYIISISFLKANTTIHVTDIKGNMKLFYSAGSIGLTGKQKKKRRIAVSRLISLLLKKTGFLSNKPVALHLNNVSFYKTLIVSKLKRNLYIKIVKSFNQAPYNGCRKKKIRRKKYIKKLK